MTLPRGAYGSSRPTTRGQPARPRRQLALLAVCAAARERVGAGGDGQRGVVAGDAADVPAALDMGPAAGGPEPAGRVAAAAPVMASLRWRGAVLLATDGLLDSVETP